VVVGDALHRTLAGLRTVTPSAEAATGAAALGHVYTRRDWGANESMRRCGPRYASTNRAVIVHHTVQSNSYSAGAVPGMIRADYAYHVMSRGWCDIGYNLLVDHFGRIWEGRYGGIGRTVIGAHAEGFNDGTVGVAFLGSTDHYAPGAAARAAFERVAVYAGTTWHFDPASTVVVTSGGSPRYRAGTRVRLYRVLGHRNTGQTACPGTYLYADLPGIRSAAHYAMYAPQFTSVSVHGNPVHAPKALTIQLGITKTAHWSITLVDAHGKLLAVAKGIGRVARFSWDGQEPVAGKPIRAPVPPQQASWSAAAYVGHDAAHGQRGTVKIGLPSL
jgi:uncharacterized protein with LGFP repeats